MGAAGDIREKGLQPRLPKSRFVRSTALVASGSVVGQGVVVLAAPVLTRLYTPEEFGVLAVFAGILGIVLVLSTLRYELGIALPHTLGSAANVLAVALTSVAGCALLTAIAVGVLNDRIGNWTNTPSLNPYLWLLPVGVALGGTYQGLKYWAIRKRAFNSVARTRLQQGVGMVATQVGFGVAQIGPLGLILGKIVGETAGVVHLVRRILKEDLTYLGRVHLRRMMQRARRHQRFPRFAAWAGLASEAGTQLPLILFASLFSPAVAGLYTLAHRVTKMPLALISQSVGQVFLSRVAGPARHDDLSDRTLQVFRSLLRLSFAPLVFFAVFAPELFGFVFGAAWYEAGRYAQWLMPWLLVTFVLSPSSVLSSVLEKQGASLVYQVSLLVARVVAIISGAVISGAFGAVALYGIVSFTGRTIYGSWMLARAGVGYGALALEVVKEARFVLPVTLALLAAREGLGLGKEPVPDFHKIVPLAALAVLVGSVVLWRVRHLLR